MVDKNVEDAKPVQPEKPEDAPPKTMEQVPDGSSENGGR